MRPKTAGERMEDQMIEKAKKDMNKTTDPIEQLRCIDIKPHSKIIQSTIYVNTGFR